MAGRVVSPCFTWQDKRLGLDQCNKIMAYGEAGLILYIKKIASVRYKSWFSQQLSSHSDRVLSSAAERTKEWRAVWPFGAELRSYLVVTGGNSQI